MAVTRVNLCLRPALATVGSALNAPWTIPGSSWARSTSMHASMPRTTGLAGSASGTVLSPPAPVLPGKTYVGSMSSRAVASGSGTIALQWFDAAGNLISTSATTGYSQASSNTAVLSTGVLTAPAGAAYARIAVTVTASSQQLTGAMVEQVASTGGSYFDGATSGGSWSGVTGEGMSYLGAPVASLVPDVFYDDSRGRVRVLATGVASIAGQVRVLRRRAATTDNQPVRGGTVTLTSGAMIRSADDYEFPDGNLVYVTQGVVGAGAAPVATTGTNGITPVVVDAVETFFVPPLKRGWLKFVAAPYLNRKITLIAPLPEVSRRSRNATYQVKERTDPIVVTAGHGSREFTISVRTFTQDETEALDESLRQGIPTFLHLPETTPLPSIYAVMGDYRRQAPSARSQGAVWTIPLTEVAAPPASIYGTGATCATLLAQYSTCATLLATGGTWQKVQ